MELCSCVAKLSFVAVILSMYASIVTAEGGHVDQAPAPSGEPSANWRWTMCLGMFPQVSLNVVGTYQKFVVLSDATNRTFVVDQADKKVVSNTTLQPNPPGQVTYTLLANGMLLQLNYATITAFSVPSLNQLWSVNTFPITYNSPVVLSSTGKFICLFITPVTSAFPGCFRVSDGFLFWTGITDKPILSSSAWSVLLESGGVLVTATAPENVNGFSVAAVEVESGTILWNYQQSFSIPPIAAADELVIFTSSSGGGGNGTWAVDIRTGVLVWSQPSLYLQTPLLTSSGLLISTSGANYISNGSTAWTIPATLSCSAGLVTSVPDHPTEGHQGQFLCSTTFDAGLNFTVGDLLSGKFEEQVLVITPSGNSVLGTPLGFLYFAVHVVNPAGLSLDCLHGLATGNH